MFEPIILAGRFTTTLEGIDNDAINELVLKRKDMKLDDDPGNTFAEDSYLPIDQEPVKKLLNEVDTVIQKNINMDFETYNQWAHILEPLESTMIHTHDNPGVPPHLSWVYYTKTDDKCGNIVWQGTVHNKFFSMEHTPKVGELIVFPNWMPHFTKKNNSGNIRISISGNARPVREITEPDNLLNIVGLVQ